jgi:glucose-1-phosphate adenylyltransferase
MDPFTRGFIEIMAAEQSMESADWFQGTADAVRRCFKHFNHPAIKHILILSGDQLYKMNLMDMYRFHLQKKAELTVACNYVNEADVSGLGIMGVDKNSKISKFVEKPSSIAEIPDMAIQYNDKKKFPGSMGIYLFNKETLFDVLKKDASKVDFGREIIPYTMRTKDTYAFLFDGYWRDIGTIKNFYEENLLLTESMPPLDMFDEDWQIYTRSRYLSPAKFENTHIEKSIVSEGAILRSSRIIHSIIGLRTRIGEGCDIKDTIIMGSDYYETVEELNNRHVTNLPSLGIGKNCCIRKAIIDKNVRIGDNVKIVNSKNIDETDGDNYFIRDKIVIIPKNAVIPSGTEI